MAAYHYRPRTRLGAWIDALERNLMAALLGLMTLVTVVNVVLRYGFSTSLLWGIEVTSFLFAWLVLIGIGHATKIGAHLGVDVLLGFLPPGPRRVLGLLAAAATLFYGILLLKGAWDFWAPYAGLDATSGRWFPTGLEPTRDRAWYETDQVPMPQLLRFLEDLINQGEPYEKLPLVIPYLALPLGMALFVLRVLEAGAEILAGRRESLIVSHEVEEELQAARHTEAEEG